MNILSKIKEYLLKRKLEKYSSIPIWTKTVCYPDGSQSISNDYNNILTKLIAADKLEIIEPDTQAPLIKLQFLADTIEERVEWVKPCFLQLINIDNNDEIKNTLGYDGTIINEFQQTIKSASISMEQGLNPNGGNDIIYGQSYIYFYHKRFMTVGTLLWLLASFSYPYCQHGKEFQEALEYLKLSWENIYSKYGII